MTTETTAVETAQEEKRDPVPAPEAKSEAIPAAAIAELPAQPAVNPATVTEPAKEDTKGAITSTIEPTPTAPAPVAQDHRDPELIKAETGLAEYLKYHVSKATLEGVALTLNEHVTYTTEPVTKEKPGGHTLEIELSGADIAKKASELETHVKAALGKHPVIQGLTIISQTKGPEERAEQQTVHFLLNNLSVAQYNHLVKSLQDGIPSANEITDATHQAKIDPSKGPSLAA